jgi:hypothetical protein
LFATDIFTEIRHLTTAIDRIPRTGRYPIRFG